MNFKFSFAHQFNEANNMLSENWIS